MGLINETNSEYYSGEQIFLEPQNVITNSLTCNFDTELFDTATNNPPTLGNYDVYIAPESIAPFTFTKIQNSATANNAINVSVPIIFPNPAPFTGPGAATVVTPSSSSTTGSGFKILATLSALGTVTYDVIDPGSGYAIGDTFTIPANTWGTNGSTTSAALAANNLYNGQVYSVNKNVITFLNGIYGPTIKVALTQNAINNHYGSYSYITLDDVINNFMVGYVGYEKVISRVNKQDVVFHAKRGLQEFSYDLLKVIKSQELTIPSSLSIPLPQDYVNYVEFSWIDQAGAKHIIYPTRVTSNPTELPIQDTSGIPTQDYLGDNLEAGSSIAEERWAAQSSLNLWRPNDYRYPYNQWRLGRRYGLEPEEAEVNGKFTINERLGKISFSSDLIDKVIIFEYISDGLAYDADMKIPKLAEEAIYMHIVHAILSTRRGIPEYMINRYKRERSAAYRNAKIRLSNIKIEEISQVFRNKAKWIKH